MVYSIEEIKSVIVPIAKKYGIRRVSLFGDYARGAAVEDTSIDLFVEVGTNENLDLSNELTKRMSLVNELEEILSCHVNIVYSGMKDMELLDYIHETEKLLYEE